MDLEVKLEKHYFSYKDYLEKKYNGSVYRIGLDGGFSCPNRKKNKSGGCAFCDGTGSIAQYQRESERCFTRASEYEKAVASLPLARLESIKGQIEKGKEFLQRRYKADKFSLYFQSFTNTYDTVGNLRKLYDEALSYGPFKELIIATRPDCLEEEKVELLSSYITEEREVWVELGLQSANDETLNRINRGHSVSTYIDAAERLHKKGIKVSTHVILGLPGENRTDYIKSIKTVNEAGSEGIKIHNLHITGGTLLENEYMDGEIVTFSIKRHLENTVLALRNLKKNIVVQRLLCETPSHRLVAPRNFADKNIFLKNLDEIMERNNFFQGDSL